MCMASAVDGTGRGDQITARSLALHTLSVIQYPAWTDLTKQLQYQGHEVERIQNDFLTQNIWRKATNHLIFVSKCRVSDHSLPYTVSTIQPVVSFQMGFPDIGFSPDVAGMYADDSVTDSVLWATVPTINTALPPPCLGSGTPQKIHSKYWLLIRSYNSFF